jgi:asparagine synthase (glutamine-hydrolysing)
MPRDRAIAELRRMVATMRHESFYEIGTWVDESLGVYVGWSVHKSSFADGMPLVNEERNVILVFSGEEFPEPGTPRRLKERGHCFDADGPEYLVHVSEDDPAFPASLNGRFHGLRIDLTRREATLFNDRFGMHRLYYHESKEAFYFAAEAKAILAVRPETRTIDVRALGELASCGCVLENRSLFKGIHLLPGSSKWTFCSGALDRQSTYFEPREWEDHSPFEPEAYYEALREVFARNLPRYFEGRQRIGMSLTGGLDTRMVMAWQNNRAGCLPCYTFGGMLRDNQDVVIARRVARVCQQPHEVIPAGEEFLSRFPHYAERSVYLTDGCTSVSLSPDLYIYERARDIAPVRMTGNYGGEVLRQVRAFKPMPQLPGLFQPELMSSIQQARETYAALIHQHTLSFALFRQAPWHHYGVLALEQTQLSLRTPFLDNDFVRTVFRAPESATRTNDACLRLIGDGNPALRKIRTDRGVGGSAGRVTAAVTRAILEFSFKAEYAYDYGMPQSVARIDHRLSGLGLERLFLGRHKFYHFRTWYRDYLAQYVRDMLLDSKTLSRPYVERKKVEAVVSGHLKGDRNHTTEIHKLLTLELLHRLFIDAGSAPQMVNAHHLAVAH